MTRYDIQILDAQKIAKGATVLVAVDLFEQNAQSFTVSSGTVTMYDGDGTADANVAGLAISVGSGLRSSVRIQFTMQAAWTSSLTEGSDYELVWNLTLGDGQTRIARQALEIIAP